MHGTAWGDDTCGLGLWVQGPEARASFQAVLAVNKDDLQARQGLLELYKRTEDYHAYCECMAELLTLPAIQAYVLVPVRSHADLRLCAFRQCFDTVFSLHVITAILICLVRVDPGAWKSAEIAC